MEVEAESNELVEDELFIRGMREVWKSNFEAN